MKLILSTLLAFSISYAGNFTLTSDDLKGQLTKQQEFDGFGCNGKNISPDLKWVNAPKETKSFAIIMYDKDAPTGSGWWHWSVFNIPASTSSIKSNASKLKLYPKGTIEGANDFETVGFGGACPPRGHKDHSYVTTIHALDVEHFDMDENTSRAFVGYMINSHTIQQSSVVSYYKRP